MYSKCLVSLVSLKKSKRLLHNMALTASLAVIALLSFFILASSEAKVAAMVQAEPANNHDEVMTGAGSNSIDYALFWSYNANSPGRAAINPEDLREVNAAAVNADGSMVAVILSNKNVLCFDGDGNKLWDYQMEEYSYRSSLSMDADGSHLLASNAGQLSGANLHMLDHNGSLRWRTNMSQPVSSVALPPEGHGFGLTTRFMSGIGVWYERLYFWDENDPEKEAAFSKNLHKDLSGSVAMSRNGEYIVAASGGYDHGYGLTGNTGVHLYDYTGERLFRTELNDRSTLGAKHHVSITWDGSLVVAGNRYESKLYLLDRDGDILWEHDTGSTLRGVSICQNGDYIAAGNSEGDLLILDSNGSVLWSNSLPVAVNDLALSADGKTLVVASDENIHVFREGEEEHPEELPEITGFSPETLMVNRGEKQKLTIEGNNFTPGLKVKLLAPGKEEDQRNNYVIPRPQNSNIEVVSNQIRIEEEFYKPGIWTVVVTNPSASGTAITSREEGLSDRRDITVVGEQSYAIQARMGEQLVDLIDRYVEDDTYYDSANWQFSKDQYKAWLATIAWGEGHGKYNTHSATGRALRDQSSFSGADVFKHDYLDTFREFHFSTGIGPFQADFGGYYLPFEGGNARRAFNPLFHDWFTIEKLNAEAALKALLKRHKNNFAGHRVTLEEVAEVIGTQFPWHAVSPGRLEENWRYVTGETWDPEKGAGNQVNWPAIAATLAGRAEGISGYQWSDKVRMPQDTGYLGMQQWNIDVDGYETETGDRYHTFLVSIETHLAYDFQYYYTFCPEEEFEVWAYFDDPRYIFIRDLSKSGEAESARPYNANLGRYNWREDPNRAGNKLSQDAVQLDPFFAAEVEELSGKGIIGNVTVCISDGLPSPFNREGWISVSGKQEANPVELAGEPLQEVERSYYNSSESPLSFVATWEEGPLKLEVYTPGGSLYEEKESDDAPLVIEIPRAEAGKWEYRAARLEEPPQGDLTYLMVGETIPQVVEAIPGAEAIEVPLDTPVELTFNREIEAVDLGGITLESAATPIAVYPEVADDKLIVDYDRFKDDTTYTLEVPAGSVRCREYGGGNRGVTITFTTEKDFAFEINRLEGLDRYETAVQVSRALYEPEGSAEAVVLARGDDFADALSGVPLAHAENAPLLLTATDELTAGTAAEIARVMENEGIIYLLGGEAAISGEVEDELEEAGYRVERLAGDCRYETAVEIAGELTGDPGEVFLATGEGFADAVAASSAAAIKGAPIILSGADELSEPAAAYLKEHRASLNDIYVLGGEAAIAEAVFDEAEATSRIAGADRWETATEVAEEFFTSPTEITLATGDAFPDALSGGVYAATKQAPVILTGTDNLPGAAANYAQAEKETLERVSVFGGEAAVEERVLDQLTGIVE